MTDQAEQHGEREARRVALCKRLKDVIDKRVCYDDHVHFDHGCHQCTAYLAQHELLVKILDALSQPEPAPEPTTGDPETDHADDGLHVVEEAMSHEQAVELGHKLNSVMNETLGAGTDAELPGSEPAPEPKWVGGAVPGQGAEESLHPTVFGKEPAPEPDPSCWVKGCTEPDGHDGDHLTPTGPVSRLQAALSPELRTEQPRAPEPAPTLGASIREAQKVLGTDGQPYHVSKGEPAPEPVREESLGYNCPFMSRSTCTASGLQCQFGNTAVSAPKNCPLPQTVILRRRSGEWDEIVLTEPPRAPEQPVGDAAEREANVEALARAIHKEWRDGMIGQCREVALERMEWDTLDPSDRTLDRTIAWRLLKTFTLAAPPVGDAALREALENGIDVVRSTAGRRWRGITELCDTLIEWAAKAEATLAAAPRPTDEKGATDGQ